MKGRCSFSAESGGQTPGGIAATAAWEERLAAEFELGVMKWCEVALLLQIPVIQAPGAMAIDCIQSGCWAHCVVCVLVRCRGEVHVCREICLYAYVCLCSLNCDA